MSRIPVEFVIFKHVFEIKKGCSIKLNFVTIAIIGYLKLYN